MTVRPRRRPLRRAASASAAWALVFSAALALLLLFAAPAVAARGFDIGVIDDQIPPDGNLASMGTAGVKVFRTPLYWSRTEAEGGRAGVCDNVFDWSYYDELMLEAGQHGIRVLPFILGSPGYAASRPQSAPRTDSPAIVDYKCFVRAAVGRYGHGGSFVESQRALRRKVRPVRQWQVWNEPNLPLFAAQGGVNPREYGRLVQATRSQVVREDRRAEIILAGLPESLKEGMSSRRFLTKLYDVRRIERKFDAVALHPYSRNSRGVKGALIRLRRLLERVGDRHKPVWLTEVGWSSDGPKGHFLVKGPKGQARELQKTFRMLRRSHRRFKVDTVNWFRWRDLAAPSENSGRVFDYAGLFRENGAPKPACRRFVRFTNGSCQIIRGGAGSASPSSSVSSSRRVAARRPSPPQ